MPLAQAEPVSLDAERAELKAVLASPLFLRSPTLAHFLSYLCERKFAGEAGLIKEYSVALEVFGRPESFDQDTDSIVRVQANRLRKRLAEYYGHEGAGHLLQIAIPVGQRKENPKCVRRIVPCRDCAVRYLRDDLPPLSRAANQSSRINSNPEDQCRCRTTGRNARRL